MTYLLFRLFNNVFNWVFRMCENERNSDEFVLNRRNGSLILLHRKKKTDRKLTIVAILQTLDFIVDRPAILLSSRHSCKFCKIQSTAVRRITNIIDRWPRNLPFDFSSDISWFCPRLEVKMSSWFRFQYRAQTVIRSNIRIKNDGSFRSHESERCATTSRPFLFLIYVHTQWLHNYNLR